MPRAGSQLWPGPHSPSPALPLQGGTCSSAVRRGWARTFLVTRGAQQPVPTRALGQLPRVLAALGSPCTAACGAVSGAVPACCRAPLGSASQLQVDNQIPQDRDTLEPPAHCVDPDLPRNPRPRALAGHFHGQLHGWPSIQTPGAQEWPSPSSRPGARAPLARTRGPHAPRMLETKTGGDGLLQSHGARAGPGCPPCSTPPPSWVSTACTQIFLPDPLSQAAQSGVLRPGGP